MILAIDIGGTQFGLALATADGKVVKRVQRQTDRHGGAQWMVDHLLRESKLLMARSEEPVSMCGIGFGGPVNFETQRIVNSTHVSGWDDYPLPEVITRELGLPAIVDNDANVGALGECVFGAGVGSRHLVYYTVSTGIGGGIVIDGHVYRGGNGNAGELGHVPILLDGPLCACGNRGCLEALCSGTAIGERGEAFVQQYPRKGRVLRQTADGEKITAKAVFNAARAGNKLAKEVVAETCMYLGMGVAATMNAFAPDVIVIGGGVSKAGRVLFDPLRQSANRFLMPIHRASFKVVPAKLKGQSVLLGAVALARQM